MSKRTVCFLMGAIILISIISCASSRPDWPDNGGGYFDGEGDYGNAFYGVGAVSNIENISLRRNAADAQARADLATSFSTSIENLVKIYARSVSGNPNSPVSEEQFVQQTTRAFTDLNLGGAFVIRRYYDIEEKTQYSLAVLDLNLFKEKIQQMEGLSEEVKKLIEQNAAAAFTELDETKKNKK